MNDAINELERISRDEGIIGLYDAEEIERKVRNTQLKGAKLEGIEQGKKEGIEQGKKEGVEQGKREERLELARKLKLDGVDIYKIIYKFEMREESTGELECENIESYHIDLEKLRKVCYTNSERKELIKILTMFIAKEKSELDSLRSEEYMNDAINELERISRDEGIIGLYDAEEIERKVRNTQLKGAKLEGIEQGKLEVAKNLKIHGASLDEIIEITNLDLEQVSEEDKKFLTDDNIGLYDAEKVGIKVRNTQLKGAKLEGIEEGKREGIEQGKKEGIEQGKREERLELARKFKNLGVSIQDIEVATGLSREIIEKL